MRDEYERSALRCDAMMWLKTLAATLSSYLSSGYTANKGPARIQYKFLVPIHGFPEIKLCCLIISKTEL
jgi:hypothetical protein